MKRTLITFVTLALSFGVLAQESEEIVVSSGDIEITRGEFEAALENLPQEYRAYASGPGRKAFAKDFLRMKVLARAAEKANLPEEPKVKAQLDLMRSNLLASAQLERMSEEVEVAPEALEAAYEARKGQLEQASARHILVAFEGSPAAGEDAPTEEEAKARAEALRNQLLEGAEFTELAKESDDTGSASRGGDLGTFSQGQMVPAFDQAVFSAASGELLPVIRTQFGYHVIEVTGRSTVPFEEIRDQLELELQQEIVEERIEQLEGDIASTATFDPDYFGEEQQADQVEEDQSR